MLHRHLPGCPTGQPPLPKMRTAASGTPMPKPPWPRRSEARRSAKTYGHSVNTRSQVKIGQIKEARVIALSVEGQVEKVKRECT